MSYFRHSRLAIRDYTQPLTAAILIAVSLMAGLWLDQKASAVPEASEIEQLGEKLDRTLQSATPTPGEIERWNSSLSETSSSTEIRGILDQKTTHTEFAVLSKHDSSWMYWSDHSWPIQELPAKCNAENPWQVVKVKKGGICLYCLELENVYIFRWLPLSTFESQNETFFDDSEDQQYKVYSRKLNRELRLTISKEDNHLLRALSWSCLMVFLLTFIGLIYWWTSKKKYSSLARASIIAGSVLLAKLALLWYEPDLPMGITALFLDNSSEIHFSHQWEWVSNIALLSFLIAICPHPLQWSSRWTDKNLGSQGLALFYFLSLLMTFYFAAAIIRHTLLHMMPAPDPSSILYWQWQNIFWYGCIVLFVSTLFIASYRMHRRIVKTALPLDKKLLLLLAAGSIFLPIVLYFPISVHPFAFFIVAFIIIILLDLFAENVSGGLTWPFIWLTVLAGCTSLLIFSFSRDRFTQEKERFLLEWVETERPPETQSSYFSIARYEGGERTFSRGQFLPRTYPLDVTPNEGEMINISLGQRNYQIAQIEEVQYLIMENQEGITQPISLYAFLFVLWVMFTLLLLLLNNRFELLPSEWHFYWSAIPSLRKRIQYYILAVTVGSFLMIAWVTYFYFQQQGQKQVEQVAVALTSAAIDDLEEQLERQPSLSIDSAFQQNQSQHRTSGNLYDPNGQKIIGEGNPLLPHESLTMPNFRDKRFATRKGEIYHPVLVNGEVKAIAQYNTSSESMNLNYEFGQFISTLLNIYVFLFVLAGGIAVAISNSITAPLKVLSERLKSLKLGKKNIPLDWKQKDELGELISDYNRMILQLEESAKMLAATERETAWREMAKQVAHEIKNPLTPMKLSLQHLQLAIDQNSPNKEELFRKVSQTLIEQIDNLNRIASEFSSFAKMPEPENRVVSLNEVVASIHDLFRKREDMDIQLFVPIDEIRVFADKDHLLRVMSNLVKNSIQAIPDDRRGEIVIKLYKKEETAIILVSDNGKGIPEEVKEKVFKPNFTSKNSGTGLGLAICANIIEGFNGKIYFETEVNKGTDFYVIIPLMRTKDNLIPRERVML